MIVPEQNHVFVKKHRRKQEIPIYSVRISSESE